MGLFKKISQDFAESTIRRKINKANISPERKALLMQRAHVAADLVSNNFEDGLASGVKVTVAFIAGMAGGPIGAFGSAAAVAGREAAVNQQKFIQEAVARGIPITVDGELINAPTVDDNKRVINTSAIVVAGTGTIGLGALLYWMFK